MKALLTKKTIVIASLAVLIAVITIVSVNVFNSSGPVTGVALAVTRPIRSLALTVVRTFENIYSSIYKYEDLQKQYEEALKALADTHLANRDSDRLLQENIMLRAHLGFRERHAAIETEEAMVVDWSSANWASSFTINRGFANSETTVAQGNSVVTEYGVLIGQIVSVSAETSTVVTVLDTTFSASVYVGDGEEMATVKGDFALMSSGLLMLDYISDDLVVLPGDSVVTAGTSGIFPANLVIGEVEEVLRHSTGIGRYATIKPMRTIDITLMNVYVITSFDISG